MWHSCAALPLALPQGGGSCLATDVTLLGALGVCKGSVLSGARPHGASSRSPLPSCYCGAANIHLSVASASCGCPEYLAQEEQASVCLSVLENTQPLSR